MTRKITMNMAAALSGARGPAAALLLAVATPTLAQGPADTSVSEGAGTTEGRISGRVVGCPSGSGGHTPGAAPGGAEVLLMDPRDAVQPLRLDADGRFSVEGLAPGSYELFVTAPGCAPAGYRVRVAAGGRATVEVVLADAEVLEDTIEVQGRRLSAAEERLVSAEAVAVVELGEARRQSADLGEVVSRGTGAHVQRSGGLGSGSRFSLQGLSGEQVRFFLDGIPLELAGFGSGLANVPVHLLERVEVYRGVVPVRYGADALGGAVNLVSATGGSEGDGLSASLQGGSFGTWRGAISGRSARGPGGLFVQGHLFGDVAENDYAVDVEVADAQGRLSEARVRRFHDAYAAAGAGLEVGVAEVPWAERLSLRLFGTRATKELQHNVVMSVPFGEATTGEWTAGALLHFARGGLLDGRLRLEAVGGYSRRDTETRDVSPFLYDWFGQVVRERNVPGELAAAPVDQVLRQPALLARLHAGYALSDAHALRFTVAPTYVTRSGENRLLTGRDVRDPLRIRHEVLTLVSGAEHEARLWDGRLKSLTFLKGYLQGLASSERLQDGSVDREEQGVGRLGGGSGLRLFLPHGLMAKASYEYATRLPGPDERFGNGVLDDPNLGLRPEVSHNANLELSLAELRTQAGVVRGNLGAFARLVDDLIVYFPVAGRASYQNVTAARSLGLEVAAGWTAPGAWLAVDANTTWQDFRNASADGAYGAYLGDRIPNQPWLFANLAVRLQRRGLLLSGDEVSVSLASRYVHAFFRGWESQGLRELKAEVPAQLTHALSLGYTLLPLLPGAPRLSVSLEALNLTDARVYDVFGVQRPGRSFSSKLTLDL